jgi:glycosyltransferase involved in cell wall biosynthesis
MKISVILPVMNETFSLSKTVEIINRENPNQDFEFFIVTATRTKPESLAVIEELKTQYPDKVVHHVQTLPFIGGAIRESFERVTGDYTILMASDLETDPHAVKDLIQEMANGYDIVTCTRWRGGAGFSGYNPIKYLLNKIFQIFFGLLYWTRLTDLTFAYRIFKTEIVKSIRWEELRHPFLFETIVKPLRLGYRIKEIPSSWKAREEGESQNTFFRNFAYFKIGLKVLFTPKEKLLK